MRSNKFAILFAVFCSLLFCVAAQAASVSGTVTNKTTGKPTSGDLVELVDVQAGMSVAGKTTTGSSGKYTLDAPGSGPYLIRVTHQGAPYFIAAPQGGAPGDISVYDSAANVDGISIEADVIEMETANGQLQVTERYFVHNRSTPPTTQYSSAHGFEIVLPEGATVDGAEASRPTGLPTSTVLKPSGAKNHFMFDFPIQPDEGEKDTVFQLSYHMAYSGKAAFRPDVLLPADNVAVLLPLSIQFEGSGFQSIKQDPGIQTWLARNVKPGAGLEFAISGNGSMPRETQQGGGQQEAAQAGQPAGGPGGGIGEPINTPDPLTKYKWWILGGLGLALAAAAAFLLRRPAGAAVAAGAGGTLAAAPPAPRTTPAPIAATPVHAVPPTTPAGKNGALLSVLKEEMFSLESEKLSGTISAAEYGEQKAALETVLKRALKKSSRA